MAKAIRATYFDTNKILKQTRTFYTKQGDIAIRHMRRTTRTFETVDPTFIKNVTEDSDDQITVRVGPKNDQSGQIWSYLNNGTDIRFFGMVDPFEAKTAPGQIDSGTGQNSGVFFVPEGLPGIEARDFVGSILKEMEPQARSETKKLTKRMAKARTKKLPA